MGANLERVQENSSPHLSRAGLNGQENGRGRVSPLSFFSHSDDDASLSAHRKHAPVSSSALMTGLPAEDASYSYAQAVVYVQLARMCASMCLISCLLN